MFSAWFFSYEILFYNDILLFDPFINNEKAIS
jgi:hypothetical protein